MQVDTKNKWLRISPWQEWYDLWNCPGSNHELVSFFDRFLNNKENDFEKTPRVRISLLNFTKDPVYDIVEEDYPIPRTEYKKLFFTPDNKLNNSAPVEAGVLEYNAEEYLSCASFTHTFTSPTNLAGLPKAVLYMECSSFHDLDVYVLIRKLDVEGNPLLNLNIPWSCLAAQDLSPATISDVPARYKNNLMFHSGSMGILRASRRHVDRTREIHENYPFHTHDRDEYVPPGEVVRLEVGIWAMGVQYDAGESVRVEVHGCSPMLKGEFEEEAAFGGLRSQGMHRVHVGGERASFVILPFV